MKRFNNLLEQIKKEWFEKPTYIKAIAVFGGLELIFNVTLPLILGLIWINLFGLNDFGSYLFVILLILVSMFKATKIWMEIEWQKK